MQGGALISPGLSWVSHMLSRICSLHQDGNECKTSHGPFILLIQKHFTELFIFLRLGVFCFLFLTLPTQPMWELGSGRLDNNKPQLSELLQCMGNF